MSSEEMSGSVRVCIDKPNDRCINPIPIHGCNERIRLAALLDGKDSKERYLDKIIKVGGWCRSVRKQGGGEFCFVVLNDGSTPSNLQVIVEKTIGQKYDELLKCGTGCSFFFKGTIVQSPAKGQLLEMQVQSTEKGHDLEILGGCDGSKYPLAKKQHTREYLREIGHLRPRTNLIGAVMRVRSALAMATHRYFEERGFLYVHTPIITASDCEGAGEMFAVSTLLPEMYDNKYAEKQKKKEKLQGNEDATSKPKQSQLISSIPITKYNTVDYSKDFFSRQAFLTVSGQLAVEPYCVSLGDVYTFGPTFRAENSHTSRHLSEFWMIEPELAFATLEDNMKCAETFIKYCIRYCIDNCFEDLKWFEANQEEGLIKRLKNVLDSDFEKLDYTKAIQLLEKEEEKFKKDPSSVQRIKQSGDDKKEDDETPKASELFKVKVEWGMDLGAEHERHITEILFGKPVIVYNYPSELKAFYMKQNDDGKTVRAMDVLVPKIGELVGGSQREDNLEKLDQMIIKKNLDIQSYWWYRELRQYGSVPHAGFGLGFERMVMMVTGIENIRDTIPYPRYPGHAEF